MQSCLRDIDVWYSRSTECAKMRKASILIMYLKIQLYLKQILMADTKNGEILGTFFLTNVTVDILIDLRM